jgi:hypothetical protein
MSTKTKKTQVATPVAEILAAGTPVRFIGYSETPPEDGGKLAEGETYYIGQHWPATDTEPEAYDVFKTLKAKKALETVLPSEITTDLEPGVLVAGDTVEADATADDIVETPTPKAKAKAKQADAPKAKAKAKQAKQAKQAEVVEVPEPVSAPAGKLTLLKSVKEALKLHGSALAAATKLYSEVERTYLTLGGCLAVIQRDDLQADPKLVKKGSVYEPGQKGFKSFCEEVVSISYRKAQYLINIYETVSKLGISESQLAGIGWSKLKDAVGYLNTEGAEVEEVLAAAKEMNGTDFANEMKKRIVDAGGKLHGRSNSTEMTIFRFALHMDQGEKLAEALDSAADALGVAKPSEDKGTMGQCLDHIVTEWMALQG